MPENREDLLDHYRRMRADLQVAIEGISDDQLSERSLDGWSVKDHLAHIALWDEIRASDVERISAGFESAWKVSEEQGDAYSLVGYEARANLSMEQIRWELQTTHDRMLLAIEAATERGLDASLYGEPALPSTHEAEHTGWIRRWRSERGY